MAEDERYDLENLFKAVLPAGNDYYVTGDNLGEDGAPILITRNEFMRRYREMSALGGGMNFYGELPESFNITVNMQNPLVAKVMAAKQEGVAPQAPLPAEAPSDASDAEKQKAREAREAVRKAHRADVEAFAKDNEILHQITDLALLANGLLKGKALADFIARSQKVVTDAYLK
jgi:molecular chaperone HtpG